MSRRCEYGSYTLSLTHTGTPPTASDILITPVKLTCTKWSIGRSVSLRTAATVQPGPPCRVELIMPRWALKTDLPALSLQPGRSVTRSRGMLITVALLRSAETCSSRLTSALAPPPQSPPIWQSSGSSRESEPITSTLIGVRPKASGTSFPASPSSPANSGAFWMLAFSR